MAQPTRRHELLPARDARHSATTRLVPLTRPINGSARSSADNERCHHGPQDMAVRAAQVPAVVGTYQRGADAQLAYRRGGDDLGRGEGCDGRASGRQRAADERAGAQFGRGGGGEGGASAGGRSRGSGRGVGGIVEFQGNGDGVEGTGVGDWELLCYRRGRGVPTGRGVEEKAVGRHDTKGAADYGKEGRWDGSGRS